MKRKLILALLGLTAALTITACGNSDSTETEAAAQVSTAAQSEDLYAEEDESDDEDIEMVLPADEVDDEEEESEITLEIEPFDPSDYLVEDVDDYITPGKLEGLKVTQYVYDIDDDFVQSEIEAELSMYEDEEEVDRAARDGDIIYVDLTSTVEGSDEEPLTDSTYFYLGDQEYGEDFDEALIGAKAGDHLTFSIDFDDEIYDEDWENQTVDFEVDVTDVCEITEPDYNDAFVSENYGYDTTEEFETAYREYLEEEYEELSLMDAMDSLLETALENCVFSGYPDNLYAECRQETINDYSIFFDDIEDEDELLEELGMTEDDLDDEVSSLAARRLLISYICEKNNLEVTEEEYLSFIQEYAEYYGYENAYDFEQDLGRSYLVWSMYETKADEYLYDNADVNEVPYDDLYLDDEGYYDEDYDDEDYDDEDYDDEDYDDWDDETDDYEWEYFDDEDETEF